LKGLIGLPDIDLPYQVPLPEFRNGTLGIIDPATGEVSRIGPTATGLEALAIYATPEPSSGLLISAGILAFSHSGANCICRRVDKAAQRS
jgi:hypothetical protein